MLGPSGTYGGMCENTNDCRPLCSRFPHVFPIDADIDAIQSATFSSTQSGRGVELGPGLTPPRESKSHSNSDGVVA